MTIWHWLFLIIFTCVLFSVIAKNDVATATDVGNPMATKRATENITVSEEFSPIEKQNWFYQEQEEGMGRGKVKIAATESLNQVNFDFPYQGGQNATLVIRKHPKHGNDILLSIERGQFLCRFDGCTVDIKFDDGKPITFSANEPTDNSTTTIFISNFKRFLENVSKAKKLYIEADFYQEGSKIFEFDVHDLKW